MTDGSVQNEVSVSTHSWSSKMAYSETAFKSLSTKGISRKSSMKHWPSVSSCPLLPFTARSPTAMQFHLPISELFTPHYINVLQKCATSRKLLSPPFLLNSYVNLRKNHLAFSHLSYIHFGTTTKDSHQSCNYKNSTSNHEKVKTNDDI